MIGTHKESATGHFWIACWYGLYWAAYHSREQPLMKTTNSCLRLQCFFVSGSCCTNTHTIHVWYNIFIYIYTININHSCRQIYRWSHGSVMDMLVPCWFLEPNGALRNWRMEVGLISRCWFWNKNAKTLRRVLRLKLLAYPDWCMGTHVSWSLFRVVSPTSLGLTIFIFHGHLGSKGGVWRRGALNGFLLLLNNDPVSSGQPEFWCLLLDIGICWGGGSKWMSCLLLPFGSFCFFRSCFLFQ